MQRETLIIGVRALARELGLPRDWLVAELRAGRLPCLRAGRRPMFNIDAVRRSLAQRAGNAGGEGADDE